jgi:hypothetical protein
MPDLDAVALSADYETWLGDHIPLVVADLRTKHAELARDRMRFLRGTYYLWLLQLLEQAPQVFEWPEVAAVGDLHVENFGTWTDHRGVRRWGVNDFDELGWGNYALDLVRLATSAVITPHIRLDPAQICAILLETWRAAKPRVAVDLADPAAAHLRALVPAGKSEKVYYAGLASGDEVIETAVPAPVRAAVTRSVARRWQPSWHARTAGTGSLGHPRYVAVDKALAREAKLLGPPSADWVRSRVGDTAGLPAADEALLGRAVSALHGPAVLRRVDGWQVRALAPDAVRIELAGLRRRDERRLLSSMGRALIDVAGIDRAALRQARKHEARLPVEWLHGAVRAMVDATIAAHDQYAAHPPR